MRVRIIRAEGYESPKVKAAQGDVIEVGEVTGGKLIAGGTAVPVDAEPVIETAAVEPPENGAMRIGRIPKRKAERKGA